MATFILFIIILSVLVLVHEFGHFVVAKKMGVKVEEFEELMALPVVSHNMFSTDDRTVLYRLIVILEYIVRLMAGLKRIFIKR